MLPRRLALPDHDEAPRHVDRLGYPDPGSSQHVAAAEPRPLEQPYGRLREVRSVQVTGNAQRLAQFPRPIREISLSAASARHDVETGGGFAAS